MKNNNLIVGLVIAGVILFLGIYFVKSKNDRFEDCIYDLRTRGVSAQKAYETCGN